jgi:hypothetical protein
VRHEPGEELQCVHRLVARGRPLGLVRAVGDLGGGGIIAEPLERHGVARTVARQPERERPILLGDPDAIMRHPMIPTDNARSPLVARIAAVTVRAATRAISPRRDRR